MAPSQYSADMGPSQSIAGVHVRHGRAEKRDDRQDQDDVEHGCGSFEASNVPLWAPQNP
jgi:hypothetical protein